VVPAVQGQVKSGENPRVGTSAGTPDDQTLSAIALLEHRTVSSRTDRCCEAFGNTVRGQSRASSAKSNPNLKGELIRHLNEDSKMSGFDFGLQFLDADRMTYWGKCRDANFWIENASLESNKRKHLSTRSHALPFYRSRNFRWMVGRQALDVRAGTDDRRPVSPDVQGVPAESEVGQLQRGSGAGSAHQPRRQVTHGRSEL